MSQRTENLEQFAIDVILERRWRRANLLRALLYFLSFIYERLVQLRLYLYRHGSCASTLGCLVISIGSLTVGGTGKTPIVEVRPRLARRRPPGRDPEPCYRACRAEPEKSWNPFAKRRPTRRASYRMAKRSFDSLTAGDEPYACEQPQGCWSSLTKTGEERSLRDKGAQSRHPSARRRPPYLHLKHRLDIVLIDRQAPLETSIFFRGGRCASRRAIAPRQLYLYHSFPVNLTTS
jgi:tetraacyldisaccharide 4'-kinase